MKEGGGCSLHRNPRIHALHRLSCIPPAPSPFLQRMHYSWIIKYMTHHPDYVHAHEKLQVIPNGARWLVGAINLPLKLYSRSIRRRCIHKTATILPQKLHWSSMTRQNDQNEKLYASITHQPRSRTFRRQDPAFKIEFWTILCLLYTLPPSTSLPLAHLRNYIWTITYRTMHHPLITNYKDYRFCHERRRRLFVASKPKS